MNSIIYQPDMIRAILAGNKHQTRRVIDPAKFGAPSNCQKVAPYCTGVPWPLAFYWKRGSCWNSSEPLKKYTVGETLWVRERWAYNQDPELLDTIRYAADGVVRKPHICQELCGDRHYEDVGGRFSAMCDEPDECKRLRPSIHMPRWASRMSIKLTAVRVERVQDITVDDAIAEGIEVIPRAEGPCFYRDYSDRKKDFPEDHWIDPRDSYRSLWDSINARSPKRNFPWSSNPWVWAVTFEVLPPAEAQLTRSIEKANERHPPACADREATAITAEAGGNS